MTDDDKLWQDKEVLENLYYSERMTQPEMADELGCCEATISRWMQKHNINPETPRKTLGSEEDIHKIHELYVSEEMSVPEIAERLDVPKHIIYNRMEENGIERRSISEANKIWTWKLPLKVRTDREGYERVQTKVHGESKSFAHHRLIAVAHFGFDAVRDKIVHHENRIPWDNRVENLTLMKQSDHVREHFEEIPPKEKATIYALVELSDYNTHELADMFGHSKSTVTTIAKRIRDGTYPLPEVTA